VAAVANTFDDAASTGALEHLDNVPSSQ
jgi:hypothetical protein